VEGIKDYFALQIVLKKEIEEKNLKIMCLNSSDNEDRINTVINFINGLGIKWVAIFDEDKSGEKGYNKVVEVLSNNDSKYMDTFKDRFLYKLNKTDFNSSDENFEIHHLFSEIYRQKAKNKYNQHSLKNCLCEIYYDSEKLEIDTDTQNNFKKLLDIICNKLTTQSPQ
jgi:predicted ATP-dependent endonuclease of OLD family